MSKTRPCREHDDGESWVFPHAYMREVGIIIGQHPEGSAARIWPHPNFYGTGKLGWSVDVDGRHDALIHELDSLMDRIEAANA